MRSVRSVKHTLNAIKLQEDNNAQRQKQTVCDKVE